MLIDLMSLILKNGRPIDVMQSSTAHAGHVSDNTRPCQLCWATMCASLSFFFFHMERQFFDCSCMHRFTKCNTNKLRSHAMVMYDYLMAQTVPNQKPGVD